MPAKKKTKARSARPTGKKAIAKKVVARAASKGAAIKRSRKAPTAAKMRTRSSLTKVAPPAVTAPLFDSRELESGAIVAARKPVKKAPPPRLPAILPIPQSTFFF